MNFTSGCHIHLDLCCLLLVPTVAETQRVCVSLYWFQFQTCFSFTPCICIITFLESLTHTVLASLSLMQNAKPARVTCLFWGCDKRWMFENTKQQLSLLTRFFFDCMCSAPINCSDCGQTGGLSVHVHDKSQIDSFSTAMCKLKELEHSVVCQVI